MRELDSLLEAFNASTAEFLEAVTLVTPENIDAREPDGWSARQIVHHLADSEAQSYARLRRLLAESAGVVIQGYDEDAWARSAALGYTELPIEHALAVFRAVRAATADVIARMGDADLERYGEHTESGHYDLRTWFTNYVAHPRDHAEQLRRAIRGDR